MTNPTNDDAADPKGSDKPDETFTQADIDRIVADRLKREREAVKAKYADYDDLKKAAEGAKTAEDRIADLEKQNAAIQHEALRRRVQAKHGISDEDADLFLTGADEAALTAQAKRLAEANGVKSGSHYVPHEKGAPSGSPKGTSDEREFARRLFNRTP